ncbi:MAG: hypothetical protein IJV25_06470 [Prevotella sp.]|nr:hypothetical protein [Prevotella sp.]
MKKVLTTLLLSFCGIMMANAQIADGFYHIRNAGTGRYISINDTNPENYEVSQSGTVNMGGIRTYINYDSVAVSPSCVIFVSALPGGGYNLSGQGSSIYAMTSNRLPIDITSNGNGTYKISGTYKGFTKYLTDRSPSDEDGYLVSTETGMSNWTFEPINTSNEFIAIHPDVKTADGIYYGTIYAAFNFRLVSPGMKAFYISNAGGTGFTMNPIEEEVITAGTPVIIRCNSSNIEDNKIEPVIGYYPFDSPNWLKGVYCSLKASKHSNYKLFDRITMRILGLSDDGELAFIANPPLERLYSGQFLMANKAYLEVSPGDAEVMLHGKYDPQAINSIQSEGNTSAAIYTLTGVRLPDGVTSRAGIYVKDGKKFIIK